MTDPSCPFCIENGMLAVVCESTHMVCVQAMVNNGTPAAGAYLAISREHVLEICDVPAWTLELYRIIGLLKEKDVQIDNFSVNLTEKGGRRIEHCHTWLLDRSQIKEDHLRRYGRSAQVGNIGMYALMEQLAMRL